MTTTALERQNGAARAVIAPDAPMTPAELALMQGDLGQLSSEERLDYYRRLCISLGLNPLTRPFHFYKTNDGKVMLYALKTAAEQLRQIHGVTILDVERAIEGDLCVVTVRARDRDGRGDLDIGAVSIAGLKGEALANAIKKSITQGKRRVTLSICGLGWADESEVDSIPGARAEVIDLDTGDVVARPGPAPRSQSRHQQAAGRPETRPDLLASEAQVKAIYAIGRGAQAMSEQEIDARCHDIYGCLPPELTRRAASEFIDRIKGGSVPSPVATMEQHTAQSRELTPLQMVTAAFREYTAEGKHTGDDFIKLCLKEFKRKPRDEGWTLEEAQRLCQLVASPPEQQPQQEYPPLDLYAEGEENGLTATEVDFVVGDLLGIEVAECTPEQTVEVAKTFRAMTTRQVETVRERVAALNGDAPPWETEPVQMGLGG